MSVGKILYHPGRTQDGMDERAPFGALALDCEDVDLRGARSLPNVLRWFTWRTPAPIVRSKKSAMVPAKRVRATGVTR